ncbi:MULTISPECIES: gp16 family protein [Xenorhabdus]|uniref:GemA protein n=2 Tax=Xenorhabdus TaxID=626 RepID=A0A2D0IRV4_9GAMM|nr:MULTISPECIES: regulatory protein GemA [Xenorhabdus]OKP07276.1 GemA protein [Xenorhabdus thuongxuanensis]PHM24617.1 GemA protein [Xenorhabdus ehlersii]RKE91256.1 phage gp16-like protein [Xenorhabdus ehlersii]
MTRQKLIQLIHIARSNLKLDEDTYRQMLLSETKKTSTRDMDIPQLTRVLETMKKRGFKIKPAKKSETSRRLDSHPQSKKIRALWLEMASMGIVRDSSEQALAQWVKRETGIDSLQWLNSAQASRVIEKLKKWQHRVTRKKA